MMYRQIYMSGSWKNACENFNQAQKSHMKTNQFNDIESRIIELRDQKVILDSDVAAIYGVETKRINEAVQRNLEKFPKGYIFELNKREWQALKSHSVISIDNKVSSSLKSQNATSKGGKMKLPKAFTEKGLYMLATILKSPQATTATLRIIETFAKVREFSRTAKALALAQGKDTQKKLINRSGELIRDILNQEFAGDASSETTIELNLAMIKIKHTIRKEKKK